MIGSDDGRIVLDRFTWFEIETEEQDNEVNVLVDRLDPDWQRSLRSCGRRKQELVEIFVQLGRRPKAIFDDGWIKESVFLTSTACCERGHLNKFMESLDWRDHIRSCNSKCMCIPGTLHRVSMITKGEGPDLSLIGINARVGRSLAGALVQMCPWIVNPRTLTVSFANKSILIIGRPGIGKTTILREIAHGLSRTCFSNKDSEKTVVVVDKINEIAGNGDAPHSCIGESRWMPCGSPDVQPQIMLEAIENVTPDVVIVDEICDVAEVDSARAMAGRGVCLIATVQGNMLVDILNCKTRHLLLGGVQNKKRLGSPAFDMAIEIHSRDCWILHPDVKTAVDNYLLGKRIEAIELRPGVASVTVGIPSIERVDYCYHCASNTCSLHETDGANQLFVTERSAADAAQARQNAPSSSRLLQTQRVQNAKDLSAQSSSSPYRRPATPPQSESSRFGRTSPGRSQSPRYRVGVKAGFGSSSPQRSNLFDGERPRPGIDSRLQKADSPYQAVRPQQAVVGVRVASPGHTETHRQRTVPGGNLFSKTASALQAASGGDTLSSALSMEPQLSKQGAVLSDEVLKSIRAKLTMAASAANANRRLEVLFERFDKDGTGTLEDEEVRLALRRALRISPTVIPDSDIYAVCAALDVDNSGSVQIDDLVAFIRPERQSGRKMPWE